MMAKYTFSMESDDLHEVVHFLNTAAAKHTAPAGEDPRNEEVEVVAEDKPKATRQRKAPVTEPVAAQEADAPATEEHPMLKVPSLIEIKEKANAIIINDPTKGPKLVATLKERFGVSAFGGVSVDDYARCWSMLEELEG